MSALERVYRDTDSGGWGWETRAQSGGGGGGDLFAQLEVTGTFPSFGGSVTIPCSPATSSQTWLIGTTTVGPVTLAALGSVRFVVYAPVYSAGTLTMGLFDFVVANADGSEKLALHYEPIPEIVLPSDDGGANIYEPDLSAWDVAEQIGSDLALGFQNKSIRSTAGGQFFATGSLGLTALGVS